jgi:hypothetical protein
MYFSEIVLSSSTLTYFVLKSHKNLDSIHGLILGVHLIIKLTLSFHGVHYAVI